MARKLWRRDELILAFNLYCKIPFGRIHNKNPQIIELANILGRTPSSVSWKLANFARLDPNLQARGIQGAPHGSKADVSIWNEFVNDWETLAYNSELLLAAAKKQTTDDILEEIDLDMPIEGKERETIVKARVNQNFFRQVILAAYDYRCCITGLSVIELLIASHIIPWSEDPSNRVNPKNGVCLNAIHDRAFDRGLITITPEHKILISERLKGKREDTAVITFLISYEGKEISPPKKFAPDPAFLEYHLTNVFQG